jgi:hypothetical protein
VLQGWSLPAYGAMLAAGLMVELHRIYRARIDIHAATGGVDWRTESLLH